MVKQSMRDELFAYIKDNFGVGPDYPFKDDNETVIFRHGGNRKWFAAVIRISRDKLGLEDTKECYVVNLKCDPSLSILVYQGQPGIFPGYHMNKKHWISLLLDGTVNVETVWQLVNASYGLIAPKKRKNI